MIDTFVRMLMTGGLFSGALFIGFISAMWAKIKGILSRAYSVFIVEVTISGELASAVKSQCWSSMMRSPFGRRRYDSANSFVRPRKRHQTIAIERLGMDPIVFWNGWRPMLVGAGSTGTINPGSGMPGGSVENDSQVQITFIRGTYNLDQFLIGALDRYNDKFNAGGETKANRFFIERFTGSGSRKGMNYDGGIMAAKPDGKYMINESSLANSLATGESRLLRWKAEDIGPELPVMKKALDGLAYPPQIQEIIVELDHWLKSEQWYSDKSIPWTRGWLLFGKPGTGKCLGKGTPVLMFDGSIKAVEDIRQGDLLMGPDSRSRRVLGTTTGREAMYRVTPVKGEAYVVNESHILSLRMSGDACGHFHGEMVNISVRDYLKKSNTFKRRAKGWRSAVDFSNKEVPLAPYVLGVWLGDGTSSKPEFTTADTEIVNEMSLYAASVGMSLSEVGTSGDACTYLISAGEAGKRMPQFSNHFRRVMRDLNIKNNKHIPHIYLTNSRQVRLEVLAGLIDTDGESSCRGYSITTKFDSLAEDILYLCRSLGFAAYKKRSMKSCTNCQRKEKRSYWRIFISGDTSIVPVRLAEKANGKRTQAKDVLRTAISVESIGEGEYFGFELDRDGLFLLGDFTVTHNTSLVRAIAQDYNLPIFVFDLASMSNNEFTNYWKQMRNQSPCIALFEDIDAVFNGRENVVGDEGGGLTWDCFLNALSGIEHASGIFKIVTTNRPELLDESLGVPRKDATGKTIISTRPGRCDRAVEVPVLDLNGRIVLANRILCDCPDYIEQIVIDGDGDTGAQFIDRCAQIALAEHWKVKDQEAKADLIAKGEGLSVAA